MSVVAQAMMMALTIIMVAGVVVVIYRARKDQLVLDETWERFEKDRAVTFRQKEVVILSRVTPCRFCGELGRDEIGEFCACQIPF